MPHRLLAALSLSVALVLSGCSDDPEPKVAPEPSALNSPATASPSGHASGLGPEGVVRAWVEARNEALEEGNTTAVRKLSSPSCKTCEDLLRPIETVHAEGGEFDTPGWRVAGTNIKREGRGQIEIDTALIYASGSTTPSAGAEPVRYGEEKHIAVFRLVRADEIWLVDFIGYLS
ncbi:hypothetical protein AB0N29_15725 [Nocardioides sp. NPDC092400]|uniref:hypothetical protein n=1 Tax=Nocardioides sp. NPDC092400 TaxID=3155196 RepID=UPI003449BB8A